MDSLPRPDKLLTWLHGEVKTPPFSKGARLDADAVIVLAVFAKKTPTTPKVVLVACQRRLCDYDRTTKR